MVQKKPNIFQNIIQILHKQVNCFNYLNHISVWCGLANALYSVSLNRIKEAFMSNNAALSYMN